MKVLTMYVVDLFLLLKNAYRHKFIENIWSLLVIDDKIMYDKFHI